MSRNRKTFLAILAVAAMVLLVWGGISYWRTQRLSAWIHSDSGVLQPYATYLIHQGEPSHQTAEIDAALLSHLSEGRLVVELSRSDYLYNNRRSSAWVKVFLVTAKSTDPNARQAIKLLNRLDRQKTGWTVVHTEDLTLP